MVPVVKSFSVSLLARNLLILTRPLFFPAVSFFAPVFFITIPSPFQGPSEQLLSTATEEMWEIPVYPLVSSDSSPLHKLSGAGEGSPVDPRTAKQRRDFEAFDGKCGIVLLVPRCQN